MAISHKLDRNHVSLVQIGDDKLLLREYLREHKVVYENAKQMKSLRFYVDAVSQLRKASKDCYEAAMQSPLFVCKCI